MIESTVCSAEIGVGVQYAVRDIVQLEYRELVRVQYVVQKLALTQ